GLSHAGITVTDAAGNASARTADVAGVKQDTVAPSLTQSLNAADAATGWYNIATAPAVLTYAAADATSGVAAPAAYTVADGRGLSHAGITVTDAAGNASARTADVTGVRQDTVAPTLTQSINSPAATGWYNLATGPAVLSYTATDATSGVTAPAAYTFADGSG